MPKDKLHILTRLRDQKIGIVTLEMLREAADEIERLTRDNARLRQTMKQSYQRIDVVRADMEIILNNG